MTESHESTWRAIIKLSALLFILVVLPVGSWFYLQSGKAFRSERMQELQDLGQIRSGAVVLHDSSIRERADQLEHHISVLTGSSSSGTVQTFQRQLLDQFNERSDFILLVANGWRDRNIYGHSDSMPSGNSRYWLLRDDPLQASSWIRLDTNITAIPEEYALLIDTAGTIRRIYDLQERSDKKRLIEHIALLLPIENKRSTE